jgi:hypothetical protein
MSVAYHIEFDILPGHNPGTGATLGNDVLQPSGWRSIGDPNGGSFNNQTGGPLRAIYLKTNKAGDTFVITAASAGRLFDTLWLKEDDTEALFLDAHIPSKNNVPNLASFWMRVPPNSDAELQQCDSGGGCPFTGQAFAENPPDPAGSAWKKIKSSRFTADDKWLRLHHACPSVFRDIKAYAESSDGRLVLFASGGMILLYDDSQSTVSAMSVYDTSVSTVNRISFENHEFALWRNGKLIRRIKPAESTFMAIGQGAVPKALG